MTVILPHRTHGGGGGENGSGGDENGSSGGGSGMRNGSPDFRRERDRSLSHRRLLKSAADDERPYAQLGRLASQIRTDPRKGEERPATRDDRGFRWFWVADSDLATRDAAR